MGGCETLSVWPASPSAEAVRRAVLAVRRRGVVGAPTDTLYGLLADARAAAAVGRVFRAKRRPRSKPVPLLLDSMQAVARVTRGRPAGFSSLAAAFWPGPLTIVLRAAPHLPELVTGGTGTVAVRVPRSALVRAIARQARCPLTGTSANLSGRRPARTAGDVVAQIGSRLDLVLDGGPVCRAVPSTVVSLGGSRPAILRAGRVCRSSLEAVLGWGLG